jgi:Cytochrome P450
MVLNPAIQLKAQNELDSILGFDRLPTLEDRASLPYIEHVLQETFRHAPSGFFFSRFSLRLLSFSDGILYLHWVRVLIYSRGTFLQWANSTGVPHKSLDDDIYQGMFIPKVSQHPISMGSSFSRPFLF